LDISVDVDGDDDSVLDTVSVERETLFEEESETEGIKK
jgi:hypothetical protein